MNTTNLSHFRGQPYTGYKVGHDDKIEFYRIKDGVVYGKRYAVNYGDFTLWTHTGTEHIHPLDCLPLNPELNYRVAKIYHNHGHLLLLADRFIHRWHNGRIWAPYKCGTFKDYITWINDIETHLEKHDGM